MSKKTSSSNEENKNKMVGYIYLIREREFLEKDLPIYKVGMTIQTPNNQIERLKAYKKGSCIEISRKVDESRTREIESMIKTEFNACFEKHADGLEYFKGDVNHMLRIINNTIDLTNQAEPINNMIVEEIDSPEVTFIIDTWCNDEMQLILRFIMRSLENFKSTYDKEKDLYNIFRYNKDTHVWEMIKEIVPFIDFHAIDRLLAKALTLKQITSEKTTLIKELRIKLKQKPFKYEICANLGRELYCHSFAEELNKNRKIVCFANGVIEWKQRFDFDDNKIISNMVFRPGQPSDTVSFQMGSKMRFTDYDPSSTNQKFLYDFFRKIYPNEELREYVLTLLSSCLVGENREQLTYIMCGSGSNGKKTIHNLMNHVFGQYGFSLNDYYFEKIVKDDASQNILQKKRYISFFPKLNIDITYLNHLTNRNAGKTFIFCHGKPKIKESGKDSIPWHIRYRKFKVIPHISKFVKKGDPIIDSANHIYEIDPDIDEKIKSIGEDVIALLLHYYNTKYIVNGLILPICVCEAIDKYNKENYDEFACFFNDNFIKEPGAGPLLSREVRDVFNDWRKAYGHCQLKLPHVYERMKAYCGYESTDEVFHNVRLLEENDLHKKSTVEENRWLFI